LLLLCVFAVVNTAVLVLRKEKVEHDHFRAPTWAPIVAGILCVYLVLPGLSGKTARDYYIGLGLIALGVVLWFVNWLYLRSRGEAHLVKDFDPQKLKD
jgi:APA family basic amino acid/polyamine antiporter